MNPAVILALLSDLYSQVVDLGRENAELRAALEQATNDSGDTNPVAG